MDKRSGGTSSNGGKRSVNPKRPVPRNRTSSETRKINTISDETKKYNFDEDELKKASTKVKKGTKKNSSCNSYSWNFSRFDCCWNSCRNFLWILWI